MNPEDFLASFSNMGKYNLANSGQQQVAQPSLFIPEYMNLGDSISLANTLGEGGGNNTQKSWLDWIVGTKDKPGVGGLALGAIGGLGNAYMGMQQYGLAKDSLKQSKQQFAMNYDAQRQTTNSALEDRQRARVASNSGAYESVGDYMDKNRIR